MSDEGPIVRNSLEIFHTVDLGNYRHPSDLLYQPRTRFAAGQSEQRRKSSLASCLRRTCSHTDLEHIASTREEDEARRRVLRRLEENQELKGIFVGILVSTIFFPPIGLLAIFGCFDSTIAWYTYGTMHELTGEQRSILKQMLVVLVFLYTALIVVLAVIYGQH